MPIQSDSVNFVTPLPPIPTVSTQVLPTPPLSTDSIDFYKHLSPVKSFPKLLKNVTPLPVNGVSKHNPIYNPGDNITVFTLDDIDVPFKTIHPEPPLMSHHNQWALQSPSPKQINQSNPPKPHLSVSHIAHTHPEKHLNFAFADSKIHDIFHQPRTTPKPIHNTIENHQIPFTPPHESMRKIPMSSIDNFNLFLPIHEKKIYPPKVHYTHHSETPPKPVSEPTKISFFQPLIHNRTNFLQTTPNSLLNKKITVHSTYNSHGKHVTILRSKDVKGTTPIYDEDASWTQDSNTHILSKQPSPYETVLLRAVQSPKNNVPTIPNPKYNPPQVQKAYSTINLEHLLSQMELESEVNRNLGRSADKNQEAGIGQ